MANTSSGGTNLDLVDKKLLEIDYKLIEPPVIKEATSKFLKTSKKDISLSSSISGVGDTLKDYTASITGRNADDIRSDIVDFWSSTNNLRKIIGSIDTKDPVSTALGLFNATDFLKDYVPTNTLMKLKKIYDKRDSMTLGQITDGLIDASGLTILNGTGKYVAKISETDWTSFPSILGLTGTLLGLDDELGIDLESLYCEIGANITDLLYGFGLDELGNMISSKFGDTDRFLNNLEKGLYNYCAIGNLKMVKTCVKYLGASRSRAIVPNAEAVLMRGFNYDEYDSSVNKRELGELLYEVIHMFANPMPLYNLAMIGDEVLLGHSLTPFYAASDQAVEVLMLIDKYAVELIIAPTYSPYNLKAGTLSIYNS